MKIWRDEQNVARNMLDVGSNHLELELFLPDVAPNHKSWKS
jgi:hypothetical protein